MKNDYSVQLALSIIILVVGAIPTLLGLAMLYFSDPSTMELAILIPICLIVLFFIPLAVGLIMFLRTLLKIKLQN